MKITLSSVLVDNQKKALAFYTDMLGFQEKTNVPTGERSWLTVVSPDDPNGVELVLEPDAHPAAKPFKDALVADGIPYTSFAVNDVHAEYQRLSSQGVVSPKRRSLWAGSRQRCSMTPAAISFRSLLTPAEKHPDQALLAGYVQPAVLRKHTPGVLDLAADIDVATSALTPKHYRSLEAAVTFSPAARSSVSSASASRSGSAASPTPPGLCGCSVRWLPRTAPSRSPRSSQPASRT